MISDTQAEFINKSRFLLPLRNPFASREKKREALSKFTNSLTEDTFKATIPYIVDMVNKKEDVCRKFIDTSSQVDDIISWLPRMKEQREFLILVIKEIRGKYGLEV